MYPQKKKTYYTRITIGGNLLNYNNKTNISTADLIPLKLLINSILNTPKEKFLTINIKIFFRNYTKEQIVHVFTCRLNSKRNYRCLQFT